MQAREASLRRHFAKRPCKACHHCATPETLLVLVRRTTAWVVLVGCANCHHRSLYTVSFKGKANAAPPVSARDVAEMRSFLAGFDGDFSALFGGGPKGGFALD